MTRSSSFILGGALLSMAVFLALGPEAGNALQGTVLRGVVRDEAGVTLPKVKIVLLDPERGTRFETITNKKGEFMRVGVPAATYQATFALAGYTTHEATIRLTPGTEDVAAIVLKKIPLRVDEDREFTQGIGLFQEGRYQEAADLFLGVSRRFPDHVEPLFNLGVSYLRLGLTEAAIESLERCIRVKPDAVEPYLAVGEAHFLAGRNDRAAGAFRRAAELDPDDPQPHLNLGLALDKSGDAEGALASFETALRLDPDLAAAHYRAGLARLKNGDIEGAVKSLERLLELSPNGPDSTQARALLEELKKKLQPSD